MRGWPEPVDLLLLLSQTRYNRSLAPDQAHVNNVRYYMAAQSSAGGQPKMELIRS
jgi:hypothetical protein